MCDSAKLCDDTAETVGVQIEESIQKVTDLESLMVIGHKSDAPFRSNSRFSRDEREKQIFVLPHSLVKYFIHRSWPRAYI
jgi:hypothetical protein